MSVSISFAFNRLAFLAALLSCTTMVMGQTMWTGAGGDRNWSTGGNWSPAIAPGSGVDVIFNNQDSGAAASEITGSLTIGSLRFAPTANNQSIQHTVNISTGSVLTINGAGGLKLGAGEATTATGALDGTTTTVTFGGGGSLVINNTAANIDVGMRNSTQANAQNQTTLDLRGLGSFEADIGTLRVGYESRNRGILYLSDTSNEITANLITIGNSVANNAGTATSPAAPAELTLGAGSNIIRTNTLDIGRGKTSGAIVRFGGTEGTLDLNSKTAGAGVDINVAAATEIATGSRIVGTLDLSGHEANVTAETVRIGYRTQGSASGSNIGAEGAILFDQGTFTANNLLIAERTHSGAGRVLGGLTVGGGTFVVNEGGSFVLARNTAATNAAEGTLTLTGGEFISHVDIVDGGGLTLTRINLQGGTLDMTGHNIGDATNNIDTLNLVSGVLMNVVEINGGSTGLLKSGSGTLSLDGINSYTGGTRVTGGMLQVGTGGDSGTLGSGSILLQGGGLAFNRSNRYELVESITGSGATISQIGTGLTVITTDNTATLDAAMVLINQGTLRAGSNGALGTFPEITVASGAQFTFATGSATPQVLSQAFRLTLQGGSTLGIGIGDTISTYEAVTSGNVLIKLLGNPSIAPSGTYQLVSAQQGGLGTATYNLQIYGLTNALVSGFNTSNTAISVDLTALAAGDIPEQLYWRGGMTGVENVWAVSNGLPPPNSQSNWTADRGGSAVVGIVPGETTDVYFAANNANTAYMQNTVLGYDMRIRSLHVDGVASGTAGTSAVAVNDGEFSLTIVGGDRTVGTPSIYVSHLTGGLALNTKVVMEGIDPLIVIGMTDGTALGQGLLTISGELSGTGFTMRGAGVMNLTGNAPNTFTGTARIEQGTLNLNKLPGLAAISGEAFFIGEETPSTVNARATVNLQAGEQIAEITDVTIYADNVLNLNGFSESIDGLNGSGTVRNGVAGTSVFTVGAGNGDGNFNGAIINGSSSTSVITAFVKTGTGTQILGGANTYTGSTTVAQGTLKYSADQTLAGQLVFGLNNESTVAGTLDLSDASATFSSMVVQTNSSAETSQVLIGEGESLNINGNVRIGTNLAAMTNTLFTVSGEGTMNIISTGSNSYVQMGGYTGSASGMGNNVIADFRNLEELNITLNSSSGAVRVYNAASGPGNVSVKFYAARNTTITAGSLIVGGGSQFNGQADGANIMYLGTGSNVFHVNNLNIGTGSRDFGHMLFQGTDGILVVRAADGVGRANFILGGGSGNTGTGTSGNFNLFDVRGHQVDLLLGSVSIGVQEYRANQYSNFFHFDQGVLDMQSLTLSTRTTRANTNGATAPRITDVEFNLGGGRTIIQDGILAMGVVTKYSGTEDTVKTHIANATMNINGGSIVTIGETAGVAIRMAGAETSNSEGHASINIEDNAEVTVEGDIVKVGGAGVTTADIKLDNALLDMTGHAIGNATNQVTLTLLSGTLRNLGEYNGGGNLVKSSTGLLNLEGLNTYTGRTMVDAGVLLVTHTDNLRNSAGVTVASGAVFHFGSAAVDNDLVLKDLVLSDGSTIGVSVGNLIDVNGNASATGTVTVDVFGVPGYPTAPGAHTIDVITALTGTLNGATYQVGNYYNITNFTVNSVGSTATSVFLNVTVLDPSQTLTEAWWKGGYGSGLGNVWAVTNGSTRSNWVTNQAGLPEHDTSLVPGSNTKVYFSANGAQNQGAMQLGASMSIGSLEFQDNTSAVVLEDLVYSLTLNSQDAISVSATSLPVTLRTTVDLVHAAPEIDVATGAQLELGWILTGNAWTKTGGGILRLTGEVDNSFDPGSKVLGGEVQLGKGPGFDAINSNILIGGPGSSGTPRVRLLESNQIADSVVVTAQGNGVLTLNGFNETIAGLEGDGAVENLANGTVSVLTVGAGDVSSTFNGIVRNGGSEPTLELNKIGDGTFTLGGTEANTNTGITRVYGGVLALNKTDGVNAVRWDLTVGDGIGTDTVRWLASNQVGSESNVTVNAGGMLDLNGNTDSVRSVTLLGGSIQGGPSSALAATTTFDFRNGQSSVNLTGNVGLRKTTTGEVILSGQSTYSGDTTIAAGTLTLGNDNALPTATNVVLGEGTSAGTLDLNGHSQAIEALNVNTTTEANVNQIVVDEGQTLTVNGNIQIGPTASLTEFNNATTRLNMTGGGSLVVDNVGGTIRVAVASGQNIATKATLDLSGLGSFTANLGAAGNITIGQGDNQGSRNSSIILAAENDITAGTINVGGGASGAIHTLTLGSVSNDFRVNTFNVGTGSRDRGVVDFSGSTGSVSIAGITAGSRTNFNMGTGGANTGGSGVSNSFDVSGHQADLLLNHVTIGTQPRGSTSTSTFSFDQGTLDMNTLTMGIRGLNTSGNGAGSPRDTYVTMNLGGGTTIINDGILAMARVTGTTPSANDVGKIRLADVTLNISGDAIVEINAAGNGTAISMAGAEQATSGASGSAAHARINITDESSVTVRGNIVREGGVGVTSATINLDGGSLDMTGALIGDATNAVTLNATAGTLLNLGELNGGGALIKAGAGKELELGGVNAYTGATVVQEGTLTAISGTALQGTAGLTVRSGSTFNYRSGVLGTNLALKSGATLTLENGSRVGVELGNLIATQAAASTTGTIIVDVYGIAGATYNTQRYDVITATSGLNGAAYQLGNFYNQTNYAVTSVGSEAGAVYLNVTAATELATAYWKGGFAGGANVWAISNGTTSSNWTEDQAGLDATPLVPGAGTTVVFSANGASNTDNMTLGADMSVGALQFNMNTAVLLDDAQHTLTVNDAEAIAVNGMGPVTLNTQVELAATEAEVSVGTAAQLNLSGGLNGESLVKTGDGRLAMTGGQSFAGAVTLEGGTTYAAGTTLAQSVTVISGARMEAGGSVHTTGVGGVSIQGTLSVGDGSLAQPVASVLTLGADIGGATVFGSGSVLEMDLLNGAGVGGGESDLLAIEGELTINEGAQLVVDANGMVDWAVGDTWRLFDWTGVTIRTGTFDLMQLNSVLEGTEYSWDYSDLYVGGSISIVVVPEPGRGLLLLGALGVLLLRRRRGNSRG